MADTLTIQQLGRKGDGVALDGGSEIYVPYALPGEAVRVSGKGVRRTLVSIETASPSRIAPVCPHFGTCGGCQTQHLDAETYVKWKTELVREPLMRAGIKAPIETMAGFETASRRRAIFGARKAGGKLIFGFSGRGSHTLVTLEACAVLKPEITSQLPLLARIANAVAPGRKPFRLSVLAADNGLDVTVAGVGDITPKQRNAAIQLVLKSDLARLSLEDESLIEAQKPELEIAGLALTPPPGAFVQAVKQAEDVMSELMANHLKDCRQVADLYCGVGTFALRLARTAKVRAVENNHQAIAALDEAWRATGGRLKQIETEIRDLERRPLMAAELKPFDGLVFDPPRAGAEPQARQISLSTVRKIAAVSCNPVTLARDLAILIEGGYQIKRIVPLDQFKFTPHVEVVALLEKP